MVPEGWKTGSLRDLADTVMGFAFKSTDFVPTGIPLLRMGNLYQNTLDLERSPAHLPPSYQDEYKRFIVKPGDLVMSMTGTMGKRDYGFTVEIPENAPESLLNQRVMKFVPKENTSAGYLLNLLRSEIILSRLYSFPGGTKQANLSAKQVQDLPAPIPPLSEQKKIAQILSTWDQAITTTENLLANSQQQKKALMQQLLTGKKRLLDKNGVRFAGEWLTDALKNIVGKIYGGGTPSRGNPDYWDGAIPWVTVKDLICSRIDGAQECITDRGLKESSTNMVPAGTVIICTRMAVGKTVVASVDVVINQDLKAISPSENVCSEYLFHWFTYHTQMIEKMGTGSTVKGVQIDAIKSLQMSVPSTLEEQQKIAVVLTAADQEISALQQKLDALKQEKKALMQQLLTGKRRVKVDDKEAA